MSDLAGGFASACRTSVYQAPGILDQLSAAPAIAKIAGPALAVGVLSIGSRVTMGAMALGCKGLSKVADFAGKKDLSQSLNNAKNSLIAGATSTKTLKAELGAAIALTAGAAGILGVAKLITLTTPAPLTGFAKLENYGKELLKMFENKPLNPNLPLLQKEIKTGVLGSAGSVISAFFQAPKLNNYNI
jgi:hypothetical protein